MVWNALIPAGVGLLSSIIGGRSADRAADAQTDASQAMLDMAAGVRDDNRQIGRNVLRRQMNGTNRTAQQQEAALRGGFQGQRNVLRNTYQDQRGAINDARRGAVDAIRPYAQAGSRANDAIAFELGLGDRPDGYRGHRGSEGFRFQMGQMQDAVQGSAASRGGLLSGNTLRALQTNAQGLAAQDYGNFYNRLQGQQGLGAAAAGQIAGIRQNAGAQLAGVAGNFGANMAGVYDSRARGLAGIAGAQGDARFNALGNYAGNMAGANTGFGAAGADALANMGDARAAGAIGVGNAITGGIDNGLATWAYMNSRQQQQPPQPSGWNMPQPYFGGGR